MTLTITPSPTGDLPGTYISKATAKWVYSNDVHKLAFSINDVEPSISEYIAYDTLSPRNPFIAVTQDGAGRVVYDGGFPKLYNGSMPSGTTFAEMPGSYKYILNALDWIANPTEVIRGNRKILILGDANLGESYNILGAGNNEFNTSLNKISQVGNWNFTYRTSSSYGSNINATLSELEQYVAVFVMSSISNGVVRMTESCVNDLVTYRKRGGGLLLMTDHGVDIGNINDANVSHNGSFFNMVNKIAVNFGAWFSGDYNRTPVNLGWIKTNYGDHPLYKNIPDTDDIFAGGSESRVFVNESLTLLDPPQYTQTVFDQHGINRINFLLLDTVGNVKTYSFVYVIGNVVILEFKDINGVKLTNYVNAGNSNTVALSLDVVGDALVGTVEGFIYRNNEVIGEIHWDAQVGSVVGWYTGDLVPFLVNNGDVIKGVITTPFAFEERLVVRRNQPNVRNQVKLGTFNQLIKPIAPLSIPKTRIANVMTELSNFTPMEFNHKTPVNVQLIKSFLQGDTYLSDVDAYIYDDPTELQNAFNTITPPTPRDIFDNWTRIADNNYYPKASPPPAGSEAAAWLWDETRQSAVMPLNSVAYLAFISDELVEFYDHDVLVRSDNAGDNDMNGVVMAFVRIGGKSYSLSLIVTTGYDLKAANTSIRYYDHALPGSNYNNVILQENRNDDIDTNRAGRYKRIRISRKGDVFNVAVSRWNNRTLIPELSLRIDLNSDPRLEIFKGPQAYGYCNHSQPSSFFTDIRYNGGTLRNIIIDAVNNQTYRYVDGVGWKLLPSVTAQTVYGAPRRLYSIPSKDLYVLNKDGSITLPRR